MTRIYTSNPTHYLHGAECGDYDEALAILCNAECIDLDEAVTVECSDVVDVDGEQHNAIRTYVYASQEDADADQDGAYSPSIVEW